jgi:endonuclease YncB( thermonuclease family)
LIDKPLESIVEYVFNASYLSVYVNKFQTQIKLSLVHLFTPQTDKQFVADGKAFVEKLLLHRTVGVKLERSEEGGTLVGRVFHPAGDIAFEILKNGYAKLNMPKNIDFDAEYFKTLKEGQLIAQGKNLRIWKDFKQEEKKQQQKPSATDFTGKVVEIHTGDSLTIERDSDFKQFRVFLTTVKAPLLMKKAGEDPDPYAWDSKEALRKATIGKKVKVIMEFSKTINDRNMDFASVFLEKNNKNVACILLEKGLLKTNVSKSGDNASKFLEDLLASEKKGVDARAGLFSSAPAPIRIFSDLVANPKKSKDFEAMVMKRPNRKMNGVVEYCFSGMRFKVRLDGENTAIGLNLLGVRTMANDKNQPQMLEFSNEALAFVKDLVF